MDLAAAIQACKEGDRTAQKYLFERYAGQMYALCYRYVKAREDAEELMLNGFLDFYKSIKRFRYAGENSVTPWLKKIMINECLMFLRKRKHFRMISLTGGSEISIDENAIARMSAEEIYRLITELPAGYRTVFNLYVIEGMTHKEIAGLLKITEGTSKSQLSKARNILQTLIRQKENVNTSTRSYE
jgi:RNA polymerase sigma-70 factor (ECF subfamily)